MVVSFFGRLKTVSNFNLNNSLGDFFGQQKHTHTHLTVIVRTTVSTTAFERRLIVSYSYSHYCASLLLLALLVRLSKRALGVILQKNLTVYVVVPKR